MPAQGDVFGLVGSTIAEKYRVDSLLGEGGFGVVYAGVHLLVGAPIAIKVMKPIGGTTAEEQRATELFLREAKVLFSLTHPSIVRLYELGALPMRYSPLPYVVLERLDGISLEAEVARRRENRLPFLTLPELASIFDPVLEAIAFAHERGVVHRDIKPSNVMLIRGPRGEPTAKVVDFGIARIGGQTQSVGRGAFTPRYAAPEQWEPSLGGAGPRTDVFALGLTLYEAATLDVAFKGDSVGELLGSVLDRTRRPTLAPRRADLVGVDVVMARALRVDPSERFANAGEMLAAFRAGARPALAAHAGGPPAGAAGRPPSSPQLPPSYGPPGMAGGSAPAAMTPQLTPVAAASVPPAGRKARPQSGGLIATIVVLLLLAAGVGLVVQVQAIGRFASGFDWPWEGSGPTTATASTTTTPTPPATTTAPAATGPLPGNDPTKPRAPKLVMVDVLDPAPFYTTRDVSDVVENRTHMQHLYDCYLTELQSNPNMRGYADLGIEMTKGGQVVGGSCAIREHSIEEYDAVCFCFKKEMSAWSFPPLRGTLGLVGITTPADVTFTLKLTPSLPASPP